MTKIEEKIAEICRVTGRNAGIGRQGHKNEWFAWGSLSKDVELETYGGTAMAALNSLTTALINAADKNHHELKQAYDRLEAIRGLKPK